MRTRRLSQRVPLTGFGGNDMEIRVYFKCDVDIQGAVYTLDLNVVPSNYITSKIIIGKDILDMADVHFENKVLRVIKKKKNYRN